MRAALVALLVAVALAGCGGGGAAARGGSETAALRGIARLESTARVMRAGRRSWIVIRDYTASVPARWGLKLRYRCEATYQFWPRRGWSPWRCAV
jgi:hypothetical protein